MNEDEAFIRAIVDSPGDDLPRLVYADWLDDRDDPRGAYLRAEREAVGTGDVGRLKELAVGLDPVWVARVSRPPAGVCCDGVRFTDRGPEVTLREIALCEQRLGVILPSWYQAFLLNYNGGTITGEYRYRFYSLHTANNAASHSLLLMCDEFKAKAGERTPSDSEAFCWWRDCIPIYGYSYPDGNIRYGDLEGVVIVSGTHFGHFAELDWTSWPHPLEHFSRLPAAFSI